MHIPDGYLSPVTCGTMYVVAVPFWYLAINRVRRALNHRTVPVLALFAAFTFVLMMFNIPLPGGTTGHAIGGTLLAIVLGPWAAILGISVVLGIQAIFFGDGGLLTFGANVFNMAIVLPLIGYFVYRVISNNSQAISSRRLLGAIVGSYSGILAASVLTGIELGIQPALFHNAVGTPLYAPYPLNVALPVMVIGHVVAAGPVEAGVTGLVFAYLQRSHSSLIRPDASGKQESRLWLLWGILGLCVLATPIGLLASGTAWGEWGINELQNMGLGFIPMGMEKLAKWWPAPLPGYGLPRVGAVIGYTLSALIGIVLVALFLWIAGSWLSRKNRTNRMPLNQPLAQVKSEGFLTRNISGFTGALESVLLAEDIHKKPGLLQRLDPRVKVATLLLFIIVISLAHDLWVLLVISLLILFLTFLAKIPLSLFLKRILLFVPFTAIVALPAIFITPGQSLLEIGGRTVVSQQGLLTAGFLILRVVDSVSFGLLLILTTTWTNILEALRWFRLPSLLVDVLGMTYRYIFLLLHITNSMFLARRSRMIAGFSVNENRKWLARALATVMARSQHLSEEVYQAMVSRGYPGETRALNQMSLKSRDFIWLAAALATCLIILWGNYGWT